MIRIEVNTTAGYQALILNPEINFRVELNNNLFDAEIIPGDKVFSFDIPAVKENQLILSSPNFLMLNNKIKIFECIYYINNIQMFSGHLILDKTNKKTFSAQISINPFVVNFKDKLLNDVEFGDDIILGNNTTEIIATLNANAIKTYPNTFVQFPWIWNEEAYGDANPDFSGHINLYDRDDSTYEANEEITGNTCAISAQPYLIHVIKKLFEEQNYEILGSLFDNADFQKLLLYSNFLLDQNVSNRFYAEVSQLIPYFDNSFVSQGSYTYTLDYQIPFDNIVSDIDNTFDLVNDYYTISSAGYHEINIYFKFLFKFIQYNYFHLDIQLTLNTVVLYEYRYEPGPSSEYEFNDNFTYFATNADISKHLRLNVQITTETFGINRLEINIYNSYLKITPKTYELFNIFRGQFNIAEIVPSKTINEFLNGIKDFFKLGLFFDLNKKQVEFITANEILLSTKYFEIDEFIVDDFEITHKEESGLTFNFNFDNDDLATGNFKSISALNYLGEFDTVEDTPTPNSNTEIVLIKSLNQYFIGSTTYSKFVYFTDNYYPFTVGENPTEFIPAFSPILLDYLNLGSVLVRPYISQTCKSNDFGLTGESGLRLMLYHGFVTDYPFAGSTNLGPDGSAQGTLSLNYTDEDYGIYETYHRLWTQFINNAEEVRVIGHFPIKDYFKLISLLSPNDDNVHKIRYQNINFIPRQISAIHKPTLQRIECEIIMYKQGKITLE